MYVDAEDDEDGGKQFLASLWDKQNPAACLLHAHFLVSLNFDPEDVGDIFLRHVGSFYRITGRYIP
jgi:hypothetical protein